MEISNKTYSYDKTPLTAPKGHQCKCPNCGNSFYISGGKCYSCGYEKR